MPSSRPAVASLPPLLALMIRPLPLLPLQPLLALLLHRIVSRHPRIFERLGPHGGKSFGIAPVDLPLAFVLEPRSSWPRLTAVRTLPAHIDARIAGPWAGLVGLIGGEFDGDALFFSRDLRIEGDVEAVLALRNAIDDARIDLAGEIIDMLGPLRVPAMRIRQAMAQQRLLSNGQPTDARRWS